MEKIKVVSRLNLPAQYPGYQTLLIIMALDYYEAPNWVRILSWSCLVVSWVSVILGRMFESEEDIFENK